MQIEFTLSRLSFRLKENQVRLAKTTRLAKQTIRIVELRSSLNMFRIASSSVRGHGLGPRSRPAGSRPAGLQDLRISSRILCLATNTSW
jgi:hypothetical protein